MAAISYGKRMLKSSLERQNSWKKKKPSPEEEAEFYCKAGYDKEGFKVRYISDNKGYGVFSQTNHSKGDFLLEFAGDRLSIEEGEIREKKYPSGMMVYFTFNGKKQCIDASGESGHICQYVNDSQNGNAELIMKTICNIPRLCLFAKRAITRDEEIKYNFDERQDFWWRKKHDLLEDTFAFDSEDSDPFDVKSYVSDSSESDMVDTDADENELSLLDDQCVERGQNDQHFSNETGTAVCMLSEEDSDVSWKNMVEPDVVVDEPSLLGGQCVQQSQDDQHSLDETGTAACILSEEDSDMSCKNMVEPDVEVDEPSLLGGRCVQQSQDDQHSLDEAGTAVYMLSEEDSNMSCKIQVFSACKVHSPLHTPKETSNDFTDTNLNCKSSIEKEGNKEKSKKEKPVRFCPYCSIHIKGGKLKRHIFRKHKSELDVQEVLKKSNDVKNRFIDEKRREGIYNYNIKLQTDDENMMRERTPKNKDNLRLCSHCKGFYSSRCFSKHKCKSNEKFPIKPHLVKQLKSNMDRDKDFSTLLNRFRDNEVGNLCRSDKIIKQVGYRHFNLRRHEKSTQDEVRKEVMNEMRTLARLFLNFKQVTSEDVSVESMFSRKHLQDLREAIDNMTRKEKEDRESDSDEKHGLKLLIDAVIQRSIKSLMGFYSETLQDDSYKELKMFKRGYSFKAPEIYSKARYQCKKNSLEKARHPKNLTKEWELKKLRNFISTEISDSVANYDISKYSWLRSLIIARLTLFNARRGEEPSRILYTEFKDAINDVWLSPDMIDSVKDEAEKYLVGKYKLAYLKGKGRKYVPVLIPNDLLPGLAILDANRTEYGIKEDNPYLFASRMSMSHASGWQALNKVCQAAGVDIPIHLTATKIRHWLSTFYASLDMTQEEQKIFLEHMGHEKIINKENYQAPPCVQHVRVMGKMLEMAESGASVKGLSSTVAKTDKIQENDQNYGSEDYIEEETEEICFNSTVGETSASKKNFPKKGVSVKWSKDDTCNLIHHFKNFITKEGSKNKGSLPSKSEIQEYISRCRPQSLALLSHREQYLKIRCKIFNERKRSREIIHKKIEKLSGKC